MLVRHDAGFAVLFKDIQQQLEKAGVRMNTAMDVTGISQHGSEWCVETGRGIGGYDVIISTIPLSKTASMMGFAQSVPQEHMKLISLFCTGTPGFDADVLCNYSLHGRWKRIVCYNRRSLKKGHPVACTVEVTVPNDKSTDISSLRLEFENQTLEFGIWKNMTFLGSEITPNAYPVFRPFESHAVRNCIEWINKRRVLPLGRQGRFEYLSSNDIAAKVHCLIPDSCKS